MAQRKAEKPRRCSHCLKSIVTTAAGIKTHASECPQRPA